MALRSANRQILERVRPEFKGTIKQELMQCYVELNSSVCQTVAESRIDLQTKLAELKNIASELGVRLLWSATHPFSSWKDQEVSDDPRYRGLVNLLQDTARQLITFGMHVHVGVDSGDKAIMICDRIMNYLPVLLAASSNSPFWEGRVTGLQSWRSKVMDSLPTAGLPPVMRNWSEYVWLVNHLVETGYIETIREIWWDVRPHHNFGTVEVRICDIPGSLNDTLALAALVQCLVTHLSEEIERGTYQHDFHPIMVRQNKWRAARFGLDARLVNSITHEAMPARQIIRELVAELQPIAERLQCREELREMLRIANEPTWARRQLDLMHKYGSQVSVVRAMTSPEEH
jgi:carboxylate-amine ligase